MLVAWDKDGRGGSCCIRSPEAEIAGRTVVVPALTYLAIGTLIKDRDLLFSVGPSPARIYDNSVKLLVALPSTSFGA